MNYSQYYPTDLLNGEGIRAVLFVSGCSHGCRGCYNQSTWSPDSGQPFTKGLEDQIIADLQDERIKRAGLTLSGGDPLHENNILSVLQLIERVRKECPDKTVWMWSGYKMDELDETRRRIVEKVDTFIDGRFEQSLYSPNLQWRGSSNQIIWRINPSIKNDQRGSERIPCKEIS